MVRVLAVLLLSVFGAAQPAAPDLAGTASRLVENALDSGGAFALLRDLTTVAPHRLSGSPGAEAAVAWAKATMERLELAQVRLEKVMVPRWVRGSASLVLLGEGDTEQALPVLALGGSVGTPPEGLAAEVIAVRGLEQLDAVADQVRGKIVLFNQPMPRVLASTFQAYSHAVPQRTSGASRAAKLGAVGVLVRSMTTSLDDYPHTGALVYEPDITPIPAAAVSTNATELLVKRLAAGASVRVRLDLGCSTLPDVESANVVGEIRGRELPEQIVLIGAHLDAWDVGQGAHDDGAGCAHVLEAMRLIRTLGLTSKRTIRAVLFINEENGLRGAQAYAQAHRDELERHVAALETDAGGFEPRGFTTSLRGARKTQVVKIADELRPFNMGAMLDGGGGADIAPLGEAGVPLFGLAVSSHRYFDVHHCERDRLDQVNERELALGAAAVAYLAWSLAEFGLTSGS